MPEAPKIELRLSDVDPPAPDPRRTIYRDVVNLPDPTYLGITMRIFNYDDITLYFRATGSAPGYTFATVDLGSLGSGANMYRNLDNFASRAKPAVELSESIKLILRAYTDAGYTNLRWTYERTVLVWWIDSSDPSYTLDVLNNFDDGTVQGWAVAAELNVAGGYPTIGLATDFVLSAPYSCRMTFRAAVAGQECRARLYKSFTTADRDVVYAIIDVRTTNLTGVQRGYNKNLTIQRNTDVLIYLGRPWDNVSTQYFPVEKWMRIVVPLPKNTTLGLRIVDDLHPGYTGYDFKVFLDDFKIISKNL